MISKLRPFGLLLAVVALVALPAASQAGKGKGQSKSTTHCTVKRAFTVRGLLDGDFTPSDPKTADSISIEVRSANRHARRSGEIADQDPSAPGVQVKGAPFSVSGDTFKYKLVDFETNETATTGDKVRLVGKIEYTKQKCEPNTDLEDRYDDVNIRKAVIKDNDGD